MNNGQAGGGDAQGSDANKGANAEDKPLEGTGVESTAGRLEEADQLASRRQQHDADLLAESRRSGGGIARTGYKPEPETGVDAPSKAIQPTDSPSWEGRLQNALDDGYITEQELDLLRRWRTGAVSVEAR